MHVSELSVRRPVAIIMLYLGIILLGVISLSRLSVDLLPDLAYPKLTIRTSYQDVAPVEVEEFITKPIEEAVTTVPGVRKVSSVSREGLSLVTIEFLWGSNMDFASLNVREKLDQLRWILPRECGRPTIVRLDPRSQPIMALSISGTDLLQLKELAQDLVKRRLEQVKGVASAVVTGGLDREIQVDVAVEKLVAFGLDLDQVASALNAANYNLPGGTIKKGRYRYSLRTLGEFQSPGEIEQVVIGHDKNGVLVLLKDVARVIDGYSERTSITRFNGQESIGLLIHKEAGANTVQVSGEVQEVLKQLAAEHPGLRLVVAYDQARFIASAITNVIQNIVYGGLLAFFILFFFLRDFRTPITIALSMPISIIATFTLLYFTGVNLNMMSLGGLALGVGMLVDNSIVVLENIIRHRELGPGQFDAPVTGAKEVAMPVAASSLTTIAVFLPVIYIYGVAGQLFRDQALTVTFSLLASLLVALTLLPMLTSRLLDWGNGRPETTGLPRLAGEKPAGVKSPGRMERIFRKTPFRWLYLPVRKSFIFIKGAFVALAAVILDLLQYWTGAVARILRHLFTPLFNLFDRGFANFSKCYDEILVRALANPGKVLTVTLAIVILAILSGTTLNRELMPRVDHGEFAIEVKMPVGTSLETTAAAVADIEGWLLSLKDVESVFSNIGMAQDQICYTSTESALNRGKIDVRLRANRKTTTTEIMAFIRDKSSRLAMAEISFDAGESVLQQVLGTAEPPIAIKVQGEDLSRCRDLAMAIRDQIKDIHGLKDLHTNMDEGRPEIRIGIDREAVGRYGLSAQQVATFIRNTMKGRVATQFRDFDRKIDILIRPPLENRDELDDLLNSGIKVSKNVIPLREIIYYSYTLGPAEVHREDQVRQVVLYGNIQGRSFSRILQDIEQKISQVKLPYEYRAFVGGEREEVQRSFNSLMLALLLAVALIYMILAAQFESLQQPFIILLDVPITVSATVLVFFVTGLSLNVISLIGIIVLAGVAVNDSIIKVDFINQERRRGTPVIDAIIEAGKKRLRPIIMTTVTTLLGLTPMAIGFGEGSELQRPLAVTIIGGLFFSTAITLLVVPVIYSLFARSRQREN